MHLTREETQHRAKKYHLWLTLYTVFHLKGTLFLYSITQSKAVTEKILIQKF